MATNGGWEPTSDPFRPATTTNRRLKLFLWGDSGVGKTTLALRFPHPTIVDLEGGINTGPEPRSSLQRPVAARRDPNALHGRAGRRLPRCRP